MMRFFIWIFLVTLFPGPVEQVREDNNLTEAKNLFRAGKFTEAEKRCDLALAQSPEDSEAALLKGRLALLSNRLDEALRWLTSANRLRTNEKEIAPLLAEIHYRRDEFQQAAAWHRVAGKSVLADQMESFKGQVPYQIVGQTNSTRIRFIHTDPLPLVALKVNGSPEVNFLIDTGGAELILDTDFALQCKARTFGREERIFGGGNRGSVEFGRIDSLTLGEIDIRNIPVHILGTKAFSAAAHGKPVSGIIGTVLLYHFLTTLDYPGGALVLQPRDEAHLKQLAKTMENEKQSAIPFWLAGDHYIVAPGRLGKSQPTLFFLDTGLAGNAFTGPRSILEEAGISIPVGTDSEGVGGGGKMTTLPFSISELSLGNLSRGDLGGIFGPFPEKLEYAFGFRLGGIISHQFFRPFSLTFDFTGMKVFLRKGDSTSEEPATVNKDSKARFIEIGRKFMTAFNAGNFETIIGLFGPQMASGFPPEKAKPFFESLSARLGKIERIDPPRLKSNEEGVLLLHLERGKIDLKLVLNQQNQIVGLGFLPPAPSQ